jgi:hypothetical protein
MVNLETASTEAVTGWILIGGASTHYLLRVAGNDCPDLFPSEWVVVELEQHVVHALLL